MKYWYLYEGQISGPVEPAELKKQPWFIPTLAVCPEIHGKGENWKAASEYADFNLGGTSIVDPIVPAAASIVKTDSQLNAKHLSELETLLNDFLQAQKSNLDHVQAEIRRILADLKTQSDPAKTPAAPAAPKAPAPPVIPVPPAAPIFAKQPETIYAPPEPVQEEAVEEEYVEEEVTAEAQPMAAVEIEPDEVPLKVLVADDDEVLRYVYSLILSEYLCNMTQVTNGKDAYEQAKKIKPDLIILDHNMPGMTGFDTIRAIRDDPNLRRTPIILITGREFDKDFKDWVKMEVQEFLSKPFNAEDVVKAIQKAIKRTLTPAAKA